MYRDSSIGARLALRTRCRVRVRPRPRATWSRRSWFHVSVSVLCVLSSGSVSFDVLVPLGLGAVVVPRFCFLVSDVCFDVAPRGRGPVPLLGALLARGLHLAEQHLIIKERRRHTKAGPRRGVTRPSDRDARNRASPNRTGSRGGVTQSRGETTVGAPFVRALLFQRSPPNAPPSPPSKSFRAARASSHLVPRDAPRLD